MTKLHTLWYISEAVLLALYIGFFAAIANNIWIGILAGIGVMLLRSLTSRLLKKIKVAE